MGSRREEVTAASDPSRPAFVQAQLGERICPFLGLASDSDTVAAYARSDHQCGLLGGDKLALTWQNHYCLAAEHVECPRFQRARDVAEAVTATSPIADPTSSPGGRPRGWALAVLSVIVMMVVAGVLAAAYSEGIGPWNSGQANRVGTGTHAASVGQKASMGERSNGVQAAGRQPLSTARAGIVATPGMATPAVTATPKLTPSPQPTSARPATLATPVPKPKSTLAKPKSPATYKVKSGDTLTFIAQRFHTTIDAIAQLNKIPDPNVIATGLLLKLPSPTPTMTNVAPKAKEPKPTPAPKQSP